MTITAPPTGHDSPGDRITIEHHLDSETVHVVLAVSADIADPRITPS
ncbi:hypothetical protein ACFY9F_11180 [Streptomyces sp. NPDC012421]